MKKTTLLIVFITVASLFACGEDDFLSESPIDKCPGNPKAPVSASFNASWMYGSFSMTEYWSQNPSEYIGNGFEMAIAFKFNSDGTYEQYFTSKTANLGVSTFHRSLTKGTVVIDETNKTIKTYACSAHYMRSKNGIAEENRDLNQNEMTLQSTYTYTLGTEPNGTKALYLKLNGSGSALTFLQKN